MQEPCRKFNYKNMPVEIDLKKIDERWHWSYRIGNSSPYQLNDAGESSEERALSYAFNDARRRIDVMG